MYLGLKPPCMDRRVLWPSDGVEGQRRPNEDEGSYGMWNVSPESSKLHVGRNKMCII